MSFLSGQYRRGEEGLFSFKWRMSEEEAKGKRRDDDKRVSKVTNWAQQKKELNLPVSSLKLVNRKNRLGKKLD